MKELKLVKFEGVLTFQFLGFKNRDDYGEIFVTYNNSKTIIYRGVGITKVLKKAKGANEGKN
jgi:hypothetical protein